MGTILLADDEGTLRMLVQAVLRRDGHSILEAEDGETALRMAKERTPDVVVLDWMMPGQSGYQVAKALGEDPATADIPIVMLTARGEDADRATMISLGVHSYLVKPFSPLKLLEKVNEALDSVSPDQPADPSKSRTPPDAKNC